MEEGVFKKTVFKAELLLTAWEILMMHHYNVGVNNNRQTEE